jgi:hypothetical protein
MTRSFVLTYVLLAFLIVAQGHLSHKTIQAKENSVAREGISAESNKNNSDFSPVIAAILGGLAGAAGSAIFFLWYSWRQSRREYRSLILAFGSELVSAFGRCVMYCDQASKEPKEISKSALFEFTDASSLSKFASVCDQPELVATIIDLKSYYFQIGRHAEQAADHVMRQNASLDPGERKKLLHAAINSQGTALAFFHGFYDSIEKKTALIVEAAKKVYPGAVAEDLFSRFKESKSKKIAMDEAKNQ